MTDVYAPTEPGSDALLEMLRRRLQVAIEAELAKVPVYLYTYYSTSRGLPDRMSADEDTADYTPVGIYANRAQARLMSVIVEKLLQVSLLGRILHSAGGEISFYRRTPPVFPVRMLGRSPRGELVELGLRRFSYNQLRRFIEVELAAGEDNGHYAQIRRILGANHFRDAHFSHLAHGQDLRPSLAVSLHGSFPETPDGNAGLTELPAIKTKAAAQEMLEIVRARGQNSLSSRSHYQILLSLLSELDAYEHDEDLRAWPHRPPAARRRFSAEDLTKVMAPFPTDPVRRDFPPEVADLLELCGSLFQYMLLVVEANLVVPGAGNKYYFNRALVPAMCWMLDELTQVLRGRTWGDAGDCLAPTFEYIERGSRREAYANLVVLAERVGAQFPELSSVVAYICGTDEQTRVPDVSDCF